MQRIMIAVEIPDNVPADDLAQEVAELLTDTLGASMISIKVVSPTHSLMLS